MSATPIISLDHLKTYLEVRAGVTDYDVRLSALIQVASQGIETFTRRSFAKQAYASYFNSRQTYQESYNLYGSGDAYTRQTREIAFGLPGFPVDSALPVQVFYDLDRKFGALTEIAAEHWHLDAENGRLYLDYPMRRGERTIKVTYTAGYEISGGTLQDSAPESLKLACVMQTLHLWNRSQPDNVGVDVDRSQGETASARVVNPGGLCSEAAMLVAPYLRLLVGNA